MLEISLSDKLLLKIKMFWYIFFVAFNLYFESSFLGYIFLNGSFSLQNFRNMWEGGRYILKVSAQPRWGLGRGKISANVMLEVGSLFALILT